MKNQWTIMRAIAFALIVLGAVACNKNSTSSNDSQTGNNSTSSKDSQTVNSTPTKAVQTFYDAMKNKDARALKSVMPKEMLDRGEERAKAQNKSLDDLLRDALNNGSKMPDKLETRNETIAADGKTATVEVKGDNDRWDTIHLVKEDDVWKIKDFG